MGVYDARGDGNPEEHEYPSGHPGPFRAYRYPVTVKKTVPS